MPVWPATLVKKCVSSEKHLFEILHKQSFHALRYVGTEDFCKLADRWSWTIDASLPGVYGMGLLLAWDPYKLVLRFSWNVRSCKRDSASARVFLKPEICLALNKILYFKQTSTSLHVRTKIIKEVSLQVDLFITCTNASLSVKNVIHLSLNMVTPQH